MVDFGREIVDSGISLVQNRRATEDDVAEALAYAAVESWAVESVIVVAAAVGASTVPTAGAAVGAYSVTSTATSTAASTVTSTVTLDGASIAT